MQMHLIATTTNMVMLSTFTKLFLPTLTLLMLLDVGVRPLELLEMRVPAHVPLGTRAALSCRWQLGPTDVLYSVKWYKDGKEFFRHVPRDTEPRRRFPLPGVDVEDAEALGTKLVLAAATLQTGGRYRCEVSGEGPLFPTVSNHSDMEVVAFPEHGPIITGLKSKYHIGDKVQANCTSGHSRPATQLSWYINRDPIPSEKYATSYRSENTLIVTTLSLDYVLNEDHFRKIGLKVKCLATISPVYWKSNEVTAILENTATDPAMESTSKRQKTKRAESVNAYNFANTIFLSNKIKCLLFISVLFEIFLTCDFFGCEKY